jgi:hypothetical protein
MQPDYKNFIAKKLSHVCPTGITKDAVADSGKFNRDNIFDFQVALVSWALTRGRCALFAATGLGKTRMQLQWATVVNKITGHDILILAPLAVSAQTKREGAEIGIDVNICKSQSDFKPGINITNYERVHLFDTSKFGAVVLDESSIIKHQSAKTFIQLCELFRQTPFKLCATATPAPNDYTELGTHAEFLGICTHAEMLAEYFCHDGGETQKWRLKRHGVKEFWKWVATWGAMVTSPADLGFDDTLYNLPKLTVESHTIPADITTLKEAGLLFAKEASGLSERREARRASLSARAKRCAEMVNASNDPWMIWCDLNKEGEELCRQIPDAVEISGSHDSDVKEQRLIDFIDGKTRVLITKPSIAGFGLNLQHCHNMAFVGVTDSWESYYQAVRRCWRFGQKHPVNVHIFASEIEGSVIKNLKRKEHDATEMGKQMSLWTKIAVQDEVFGSVRQTIRYKTPEIKLPNWLT